MDIEERYRSVLDYFRAAMPDARSELVYGDAYELLVAVMLSAQCTDRRVNMVTPALFRRYPAVAALSKAEEDEVYELIRSVTYPHSKARHLVHMARALVERYGGEVPGDYASLVSLPGVGRKTANVVLAVFFGAAAMPVDTHVYRVSHRIGLVTAADDTPYKVERALVSHIPSAELSTAHHWLLLHGRYVCTSKKPHCEKCGVRELCLTARRGARPRCASS